MTKKDIKYIIIIMIIFIAAAIETDIFLPALSDMIVYFSTTEEGIQSLLTWNFFGICISSLLYGPFSDAVGRKKPLVLALSLFLGGCFLTMIAQDFNLMLLGRLLQGLGSGGCFTIGTAIIFDAFQADKAVRAISIMNSIVPFIMAGAPLLGGFLNNAYGFRSNFLAITILVLISFLASLLLFQETLPEKNRKPFDLKKIAADFRQAFTCLPFWQTTVVVSLLFAGYIAFLSVTAVLFIIEFGVSKHLFPYYQGAILAIWLVGSLTCPSFLQRWGHAKVKWIGMAMVIIGGLGFASTAWLTPENPFLQTGWMLLYAFGANWVQGLYFPEGMEILPAIKGVTASILTSFRLLIAAGVVGLTSLLYDATITPLAITVGVIILTIIPTVILYEKSRAKRDA